MSNVTWSEYQKHLFEVYQKENCNIVISAGPGSAKTTSVIQMLKYRKPDRTVFLTSFSKAIVDELATRVPMGVKCQTVHSVGMTALAKHYAGAIVMDDKKIIKSVYKYMKDFPQELKGGKKAAVYQKIAQLIDLWRLFDCSSLEQLEAVAMRQGIEYADYLGDYTMFVWEKINLYNKGIFDYKNRLKIDYVDMLYLTVKMKIALPKYDEVIVDECQDNSLLQQIIIKRMIKPLTGRFIAIGDEKQCIFNFLGADPEAFNNWRVAPNTKELQLPISYRCSHAIVDEINKIYPGTVPWEHAKVGSVESGSIDNAQAGDFVLCRNNAPLFDAFFHFASMGKKAVIKDNEFTKSIIEFVEGYKEEIPAIFKYGLDQAEALFEKELMNVLSHLTLKGVARPEYSAQYIKMLEKVDIVLTMFKYLKTLGEITHALKNMLSDNKNEGKIVLMTYHKSKGLETENVYLIRLDLFPSKYAETPAMMQQEMNLMFVAISRSKNRLIRDRKFVGSNYTWEELQRKKKIKNAS